MNHIIDPWFSPFFWISAVTVLFLLVVFTFKRRVRLGSFSQETETFKWKTRIASAAYWLLAFAIFGIAFIAYMGGRPMQDFDLSFLLLAAVVSLVIAIIAFGVWKRSFWGYLAALALNFATILGSLMFLLFSTQFPCEGLGCLVRGIIFLFFAGSLGIGGLLSLIIFGLLKNQANTQGAFNTTLIALFVSVGLVGVVTAGPMHQDLVEEEISKQRFAQFPEGILYPTYLPDTIRGPVSETKHSSPGYYSYIIHYECGKDSSFEIRETPLEAANRGGKYEFRKIENFPGPGEAYWKVAYYPAETFWEEGYYPSGFLEQKGLLIERNGLEIIFSPNIFTCDLSDLTLFKIAESLEEKQK